MTGAATSSRQPHAAATRTGHVTASAALRRLSDNTGVCGGGSAGRSARSTLDAMLRSRRDLSLMSRSLQPTSSRHAAKRTPASVGTVSTHREWSIHCGPGIT